MKSLNSDYATLIQTQPSTNNDGNPGLSKHDGAVATHDESGDVTLVCDFRGRMISCAFESETVYGYTKSELMALGTIRQILGDRFRDIRQLIVDGSIRDTEVVVVTKNGHQQTVLVNAHIADPVEEIAIFVCHNITHYKQNTELLRQQQELILNLADEGVYGVDAEGNITYMNLAAAHMIGWHPQELMGRFHHNIHHHHTVEGRPYKPCDCPVHSTLKASKASRIKGEVFWRRDGTCFPVEYLSTPVTQDGVVQGAVILYKDLSEKVRAENAFRVTSDILRIERQSLEEKNTALREVLHQIQAEKDGVKVKIQTNIDRVVMPLIANLQARTSSDGQLLLTLLKTSLSDITNPFVTKVDKGLSRLTPRELEICNMIKNGLSCKDIAATLNTSELTVLKQRKNIRRKLGVAKTDTNLATYLRSI